jgi:hypothetical protein
MPLSAVDVELNNNQVIDPHPFDLEAASVFESDIHMVCKT